MTNDRPVNNWGDGDLPAPWCAGDVVRRVSDTANERLRGEIGAIGDLWHVSYVCSVDEGDGWYARVRHMTTDGPVSDRLHVAYVARSSFDRDVDWMSAFELVTTVDPAGLALRGSMLADGWTFRPPPTCPMCGQEVPDDPS